MNIDSQLATIQSLLRLEEDQGPINGLEKMAKSQQHRQAINDIWHAIQDEMQSLGQRIRELPDLPPIEQVQWAQAVLAMPNLLFLEIDTTELSSAGEIVRFVLVDADERVREDFYIRPTAECQFSQEASRINGITPELLEAEGITPMEAWERMRAALSGRYILSYAQNWDRKQLNAMVERYQLEPLTFIGEDLQRHCSQYYHREYYLSLAKLAQRVGSPLPEPPIATAIHRAIAQCRVTRAMANAVTDLRPKEAPASTNVEEVECNEDEADDVESGLDDHPF